MQHYRVKLIRRIVESATVGVQAESEEAAKAQALDVLLSELRWEDEQPATINAVIIKEGDELRADRALAHVELARRALEGRSPEVEVVLDELATLIKQDFKK